jgi:hypothetical protein
MRTIHIRVLSIATLALVAYAEIAPAQTRSSAVLNTLEVQRLVSRAQPADHVRLAAHFAALGDEFAVKARRHTAVATAFEGNPNRSLAPGIREQAKRRAAADTETAATLRGLAEYHTALAADGTATRPPDSALFEAGAGAREPTVADLNALAVAALTEGGGGELKEYFQMLADQFNAEAERHEAMAATYRGTRMATAADHCERLSKASRQAAREANTTAALY